MVRQKLYVLSLLGVLLTFTILGCGANPGAEFGDDFIYDQPNGIDSQITKGYESLASGSNAQARLAFEVVIDDNANDAQKSQAYVGVGFADSRMLGTYEGIAEFKLAYEADKTNQDSMVGYAGALITRGRTDDITLAIQLMEGIDSGNPNFAYVDRFHLGITNAEVHALLAYAYKAAGRNAESAVQAGIAAQLDASVDNTTVDQILEVIGAMVAANTRMSVERGRPEGLARAIEVLGLAEMPNYGPAIGALEVPVTLMTGSLDSKFSGIADAIAAENANVDAEVVDGVGHNVVLEAPAAVAVANGPTVAEFAGGIFVIVLRFLGGILGIGTHCNQTDNQGHEN